MALTLSGTNGVVGAGFTLDPSGTSVTAGVGTFGSVKSSGDISGTTGTFSSPVNTSAVGVSTQIEITNNTGITYNSSGGLSAFYKDVTDGTTMSGYLAAIKTGSAGSRANAMTFSHNKNVTVTSGNIIIGTSGKGIDFSATANSAGTATSELFNDYEEGTFTPAVNGGTTNTQTFDSTGRYTKIGRMVYCQFLLQYSGAGTGAHVSYNGLPFASANNTSRGGGTVLWTNISGLETFDALSVVVNGNDTSIFLYQGMDSNAATGSGGFTNKAIYCRFTYEAA